MLAGEEINEPAGAALLLGGGPRLLAVERQQGFQRGAIALDERGVVGEVCGARRAAVGRKRHAVVVGHNRHIECNIECSLGLTSLERSGELPARQPDRRYHVARAEAAAVAGCEVVAQSLIAAIGTEFEIHDTRLIVLDSLFGRTPAIVVVCQRVAVDPCVSRRDNEHVVGPTQRRFSIKSDRTPDLQRDRVTLERPLRRVGLSRRRPRRSKPDQRDSREYDHGSSLGGRPEDEQIGGSKHGDAIIAARCRQSAGFPSPA